MVEIDSSSSTKDLLGVILIMFAKTLLCRALFSLAGRCRSTSHLILPHMMHWFDIGSLLSLLSIKPVLTIFGSAFL